MPHFKCVGCKTRLHRAASPVDLVGDLCPACGSLLEPVGELSEIVGFQSIKSRDSAADGKAPRTHRRIAARVEDLIARRGAILAQARLGAARWLDDGGSFSPEAVAEAVALPTPKETPCS
jgi:hypothetical protein